jgi:hypothetical protein
MFDPGRSLTYTGGRLRRGAELLMLLATRLMATNLNFPDAKGCTTNQPGYNERRRDASDSLAI